jgi:hypothetical protein
MRFQAVKRWHMIEATRIQTLAEHSAVVALLAFYIARTAPGLFTFGPAENVATQALLHDLPEVFTGDIPSHTKRHLHGVEQLEQAVLPATFKVDVDPSVKLLIKICDLADGIRFVRLHGVDITAVHAREGLEKQLEDRKQEAVSMWSDVVVKHVFDAARFYAYELS